MYHADAYHSQLESAGIILQIFDSLIMEMPQADECLYPFLLFALRTLTVVNFHSSGVSGVLEVSSFSSRQQWYK